MAVETRQQPLAEYQEHARMFSGFMDVTVWSTTFVIMAVLALTLLFVVGVSWIGALAAAVGVGVATGFALGRSGVWYGAMVVVLVLGGGAGVVYELIRMIFGG